jgi:DNA-binding NarL/FixJ family response regulator
LINMTARTLASPAPAAAPPVRTVALDDALDLRDVSSPVFETCSALGLSLREGDLVAVERLFSFLVDQIPDRRLVLSDVLQPLVATELQSCTPPEARLVLRTCHDLLVRLRRPPASDEDGVLLVAADDGRDSLVMHMVALTLDEFAVPSTVFVESDVEALARRCRMGRETVACLAVGDSVPPDQAARLAQAMRPLRTVALLRGSRAQDCELTSWVAGRVAGMGEAVDALLQLRGPLTPAEVTALRLAADGYTNVRIARELGLSVSAVKARLEGSYSKLHAADRTHAVAIALRRRWIR